MVETDLNNSQTELKKRLQKLMLLRLLFVSLLLGVSVFLQARETKTYFGDIQTSHYLLIGAVYLLTFIYIILITFFKNYSRQAYLQLILDSFFITAVIYSTGGIGSIFSFLYVLNIINGSFILYRKGGMTLASSCSILYGLLLDLHYFGIIEPLGSSLDYPFEYQASTIFYIIVVNILAFYIVAFLSSLPSEQAKKSRDELRVKEDDISKLEALNEWILSSIGSGLIVTDDQKRIIRLNPAAEMIFSLTGSDITGKKVSDIVNLPGIPFEPADLEIKTLPETPYNYSDNDYKNNMGDTLSLRVSMSPLIIPDTEQKGSIFLFQDVTGMKRIEKEIKRIEGLALVGELAAGIAHEIRNPMASISGSIQVLKEEMNANDVNARLMEIILREIDRLNRLINDFLRFARPKPFEMRKFHLNELITESLELIKNSSRWKKNIFLRSSLDSDDMMLSDPEQIRQVIWYILLNAADALPERGFLHITTRKIKREGHDETTGDMIELVFRDSGKGFTPKALVH
ncbi:MAG: PAS domain S-box protein, partial [Deltaproteobacteria bacterium]|nr:PAS domain S-box protein [Deltaproteobacteria bacterium]